MIRVTETALCSDCGTIGEFTRGGVPTGVPVSLEEAYVVCLSCLSKHVHVGPCRCHPVPRTTFRVDGKTYSPDGVIWWAPDTMRHSDGRIALIVKTDEDKIKLAQMPVVFVEISDPLGLLSADHPKCVVIGEAVVN